MDDNNRINKATEHFSKLLKLYPASYRQTFGHEMTQVFRDMYREEMSRDSNLLEFWIKTYADIGINAMKQSLRSKGTAPPSPQHISTLAKSASLAIRLIAWFSVALAFDALVMGHIVSLFPPNSIVVGQHTLKPHVFPLLYTANSALALCIVTVGWNHFKKSRDKLLQALMVTVPFMLVPLALPSALYDVTFMGFQAWLTPTITGIISILVLAFVVRLVQALRDKPQSLLLVLKQCMRLLVPVTLMGIGLGIIYAMRVIELQENNFSLLVRSEAILLLFTAILLFALLISSVTQKYITYMVVSSFILLTAINIVSVQFAHNVNCNNLTNQLSAYYLVQKNRQEGTDMTMHTREQLIRNCGTSYDLVSPEEIMR